MTQFDVFPIPNPTTDDLLRPLKDYCFPHCGKCIDKIGMSKCDRCRTHFRMQSWIRRCVAAEKERDALRLVVDKAGIK